MKALTHAIIGCFTGLVTSTFFTNIIYTTPTITNDNYTSQLSQTILFVAICTISALLCDIDHTKSYLGRSVLLWNKVIKHRTICHSIWFLMGIAALSYFISIPTIYIIAISIGILTHLLLDALTPQGISLLWPLPFRIRGPFKSGGMMDTILFIFFTVLTIYLLFHLFL
jgi:inner membrane protein